MTSWSFVTSHGGMHSSDYWLTVREHVVQCTTTDHAYSSPVLRYQRQYHSETTHIPVRHQSIAQVENSRESESRQAKWTPPWGMFPEWVGRMINRICLHAKSLVTFVRGAEEYCEAAVLPLSSSGLERNGTTIDNKVRPIDISSRPASQQHTNAIQLTYGPHASHWVP